MDANIQKLYFDQDGNPSFGGELLEEMIESFKPRVETFQHQHSSLETEEAKVKKTLVLVVKDAVIEKFKSEFQCVNMDGFSGT